MCRKMSSVEVRRRYGHRSELNAEHEISGETLLHLFTYFNEKRKSTWLLFFTLFRQTGQSSSLAGFHQNIQ